MPKILPPIKTSELKKLIKSKKKGTFSLGGSYGLVLRKTEFSSIYQIRYYFLGKQKFCTIGNSEFISYKDAKKLCLKYRQMVFNGEDPAEIKRAQRQKEEKEAKITTVKHPFWKVSDEYLKFREESGAFKHSLKGKRDYSSMMVTYVYPVIQNKDVSIITPDDILKILKDPYVNKPFMASKLKGHIKGVFDYAILKKYRTDSNPVDMDGSLGIILKSLNSKKKQPSHNAALDWKDVPKLIKACFNRHTVAAYELIFSILTATRSKAVRLMEWSEIDYREKTWTIPLAHDKNKKENANRTIYLSKAALQLLKWIDKRSETVFVSNLCKAYSDSVFKSVIYQLNEEHKKFKTTPLFVDKSILDPKTNKPVPITQHGTARSSFKCWASADENASKRYNVDAVELCLLHERKDPLKGAYDRTKHISERRRIMEDWGNYCTSLISDKFWEK